MKHNICKCKVLKEIYLSSKIYGISDIKPLSKYHVLTTLMEKTEECSEYNLCLFWG